MLLSYYGVRSRKTFVGALLKATYRSEGVNGKLIVIQGRFRNDLQLMRNFV